MPCIASVSHENVYANSFKLVPRIKQGLRVLKNLEVLIFFPEGTIKHHIGTSGDNLTLHNRSQRIWVGGTDYNPYKTNKIDKHALDPRHSSRLILDVPRRTLDDFVAFWNLPVK